MKIKINIVYFVLSIISVAQLFVGFENNILRQIGLLSTIILSFVYLSTFLISFKFKINWLLIPFLLIAFYYSILFVLNFVENNSIKTESIKVLYQSLVIFLLVWFYINKDSDKLFYYINSMLFCFVSVAILFRIFGIYIFSNPNYFGMLVFLCFPFIYLNFSRMTRISITLFFILGIVLSESRSVLIGVVFFYLLIWLHRYWFGLKNKLLHQSYFFVFIGVLATIVFSYLIIVHNQEIFEFNHFLSSKNVASGRQIIWLYLLEHIPDNLILGHGLGVMPDDYDGNYPNLSAHNLYLQITYQTGLIGLLLVVFAVFRVYTSLLSSKRIFSLVSCSFLLAFMLQQSFEVTLFQNNFSIAYFAWIVISSGIYKNSLELQDNRK